MGIYRCRGTWIAYIYITKLDALADVVSVEFSHLRGGGGSILVFFPITQAETRFLTHRTSFRIVSDTTSLITLPTGIFVVVVFLFRLIFSFWGGAF
jgi:hypothetical protein